MVVIFLIDESRAVVYKDDKSNQVKMQLRDDCVAMETSNPLIKLLLHENPY